MLYGRPKCLRARLVGSRVVKNLQIVLPPWKFLKYHTLTSQILPAIAANTPFHSFRNSLTKYSMPSIAGKYSLSYHSFKNSMTEFCMPSLAGKYLSSFFQNLLTFALKNDKNFHIYLPESFLKC